MGVETQVTTFSGEATAIQASAGVSVTDAICRIPRLRRAFTAETDLIRQRMRGLEAAGEVAGRRVTRRMIRWFWCGIFLATAAAFAGGYLASPRL